IGALRLIQLTGLEIERLADEYRGKVDEIEGYERILGDERLILSIVRSDAEEMSQRFATPRRTEINDVEAEEFDLADLIAEHPVVITFSHAGYVKRLPLDTYREQGRGGVGIRGGDAREGDFIEHLIVASSHDD